MAAGRATYFTVVEGEGYIWRRGNTEVNALSFNGIGPCIALIIRGYSSSALELAAGIHFDSDPLAAETIEAVLAKFNRAREEGRISRIDAVLIGGFDGEDATLEACATNDASFREFLRRAEMPEMFIRLDHANRKKMVKDCTSIALYTPIENALREHGITFTIERRRPLLTGSGTIVNFAYNMASDSIGYYPEPLHLRYWGLTAARGQTYRDRMTAGNPRKACPYRLYDDRGVEPEIIKAPGCWDYVKLAFQSICCCGSRTPAPGAAPHVD